MSQSTATLFKNVFDQSQTILIIYPPDALRDHLFAASVLYKTIQVQTDKKIQLISARNLAEYEPDIAFLAETKTDIGHKNLCITFDHDENSVDKVSYHVDEENKKFYLTIKPKEGFGPLDHQKVEFSYIGAEADMVILIGVDDLEALEQVYIGYENLYQNTALVSINSYETTFGSMKVDTTGYSSTSEYIATLLNDLQLAIDSESASNLLAGIDEETSALTSFNTTPNTFETVAQLLRSGGKRFARSPQIDGNQADQLQSESELESEPKMVAQEKAPAVTSVDKVEAPTTTETETPQKIEKTPDPQAVAAKQQKKQKNKVRSATKNT